MRKGTWRKSLELVGATSVLIAWDWVATASTRFIAGESAWAILLAGITTLLWYGAVRFCQNYPTYIGVPLFVLTACVGTWFGIIWP